MTVTLNASDMGVLLEHLKPLAARTQFNGVQFETDDRAFIHAFSIFFEQATLKKLYLEPGKMLSETRKTEEYVL